MISDLSVSLAEFLHDCISSYEQLETLLLLARTPARDWSREELAESLNVSTDSVEGAMTSLVGVETLVEATPGSGPLRVRYAPRSEEIRDIVSELARAYAEQRLAVVQVMNANAMERVRSSAPRRLAEAFRFERSKK